jgi:hypothetical protein
MKLGWPKSSAREKQRERRPLLQKLPHEKEQQRRLAPLALRCQSHGTILLFSILAPVTGSNWHWIRGRARREKEKG